MLCCLLVYAGGYHLVYAVYQYGLKQEMRAYLKTHPDIRYGSFFSLRVNNAAVIDPSFEWEEQNEEFRYKGQLYDVVTVRQKGDSLYISALKDDNENQLEQQIRQVRKEQPGSPVSAISVFKFSPAICSDQAGIIVSSPASTAGYPTFHMACYPVVNAEVHTPPPRC